MKTFAVGMDLGATTIKTGVIDTKGRVVAQYTADTRANKGPAAVIQQMIFSLREVFSKHKQSECFGIGIGSPGVVSTKEQLVSYPPNFADWTVVELGKAIRKAYPLPVFLENDANCAALAESINGAGGDIDNFLFVIWGTGVGGGIILNKKIYQGPHGGAGEIGHVSIDYGGPECNCGSFGCIEAYIGQRYLSARTREILKEATDGTKKSLIVEYCGGRLNKIDPALISRAAEDGDQTAVEILTEAGRLLGYSLASVLNVLDLDTVIIGGGLSAVPKFVYTAIGTTLKARVLKSHKPAIHVLRAALGNSAGMIGAASLVM